MNEYRIVFCISYKKWQKGNAFLLIKVDKHSETKFGEIVHNVLAVTIQIDWVSSSSSLKWFFSIRIFFVNSLSSKCCQQSYFVMLEASSVALFKLIACQRFLGGDIHKWRHLNFSIFVHIFLIYYHTPSNMATSFLY